jgi:predicted rRNA methylase YqxC with S4 and FtsJ domains
MIKSLDVRRNPDGSIDFDFYRRRAIRRRRLALRLVLKNRLAANGRVAKGPMQAINRANKVRLLRWQADGGLK